ncbi:tetratricopeptide repeat protein [Mannheimia indoligenes]|uniref:tetratricopeptide repeat protein n=1 Tax=Mannheimia indoligenes TaxID=3103145 RepID=UPI002FE5DCA8
MNLKKSLLIALFSFGIAQSALAKTNGKNTLRILQLIVQEDTSAAFLELKQFAEQGEDLAQYTLGERYQNGEGVAQSDTQAAYWYTKAAEQGYLHAQFSLGEMYYNGKGVTQSTTQAAYWLTKAAEQEHAIAQYSIGYMYALGDGVTQSDKQAVYWLEKAAEQKVSQAQYALGFVYEAGWLSVPQDLRKAKHYYGLACDDGYNKGCEKYAELDKQGVK